jgi:hypothetical protein
MVEQQGMCETLGEFLGVVATSLETVSDQVSESTTIPKEEIPMADPNPNDLVAAFNKFAESSEKHAQSHGSLLTGIQTGLAATAEAQKKFNEMVDKKLDLIKYGVVAAIAVAGYGAMKAREISEELEMNNQQLAQLTGGAPNLTVNNSTGAGRRA